MPPPKISQHLPPPSSSRAHPLGAVAVAVLLCGLVGEAPARPAATGLYAEAGAGATTFVGAKAEYSGAGPAFDLRTGYELFPWLALGVRLGASTHAATLPPPPGGEHFQLYTASADLRLGYLYRRVGFFVDGGIGVTMISTNILAQVDIVDPDENSGLCYAAGGGLEYQLVNRHHAFGVAGQWLRIPDFDAMSQVTIRAYLRYTY